MGALAVPLTFVEVSLRRASASVGTGRLFMFVFTAYMDESGTHDGSPVTIMGGLLGRAQQWKNFNLDFNRLREAYGFRVFHTKKFKRKSGDFHGWSDEKCLSLSSELAILTNDLITDGVAVSLLEKHYEQYCAEDGSKARRDSRYGLCFRIGLIHFMTEVLKRKYRGQFPPLHVVLEFAPSELWRCGEGILQRKKGVWLTWC